MKYRFLLIIPLVFMFLHIAFTVIDGLFSKPTTKADIALVMGNTVNTDGTLSYRLKQRLLCAIDLYNNQQINRIIVSGGLGKEGFWEGDKMMEFLLQNGIPSKNIIVDNYGNKTELSVLNTIMLQQKLKFNSVVIVSQYFHLTRSKMLCRKHEIKNVSAIAPLYFECRDFYALIREFFAYYSQLI